MHVNAKDLTGMRFGRLIAMRPTLERRNRHVVWECHCDCGNDKLICSADLLRGLTRSCGCLEKEMRGKHRITHHKSNTRIYRIHNTMKRRCYEPNFKDFEYYGGRGIKVCDEWLGKDGFISFYKWAMTNGYMDDLTIDRINTNGNYEPSNCRWITIQEQQKNKRSNHYLTYKGETHTMTEWCEITGMNINTLNSRVNQLGWEAERALGTPVKSRRME